MDSNAEIRKVQGLAGRASLGVTLPSQFAHRLGMEIGSFVKIRQHGDTIVIEKLDQDGDK